VKKSCLEMKVSIVLASYFAQGSRALKLVNQWTLVVVYFGGVLVEGVVDSGNIGFADILVSSEELGNTLLSACDGLLEFWVMNVGVCGDDVVIFFGAVFVSEIPHCGQNVACLRNSALHLGQRLGETVATKGCACCGGIDTEESCDD
jgi:hypothetical protein